MCCILSTSHSLLQASYFLFAVSTLMTKTSVCTDPIIYFWLNTQAWIVISYQLFNVCIYLNLFSQFQFRKELLSLTGCRLSEREPSQSMTGISLTSFYTRPIIRSAEIITVQKQLGKLRMTGHSRSAQITIYNFTMCFQTRYLTKHLRTAFTSSFHNKMQNVLKNRYI